MAVIADGVSRVLAAPGPSSTALAVRCRPAWALASGVPRGGPGRLPSARSPVRASRIRTAAAGSTPQRWQVSRQRCQIASSATPSRSTAGSTLVSVQVPWANLPRGFLVQTNDGLRESSGLSRGGEEVSAEVPYQAAGMPMAYRPGRAVHRGAETDRPCAHDAPPHA